MRFRVAKDSWTTRQGLIIHYDKVEHLISWFFLYVGCYIAFGPRPGLSAAVAAGVMWELKDAIMPWERFGFWGGDGFSFRDLAADLVGIGLGMLAVAGYGFPVW